MRVVGRPWTAGAHKRKGVAPGPAGAAAWPTDGSAGARDGGGARGTGAYHGAQPCGSSCHAGGREGGLVGLVALPVRDSARLWRRDPRMRRHDPLGRSAGARGGRRVRHGGLPRSSALRQLVSRGREGGRVDGWPWTANAHERGSVAPGPAGAAAWPTEGSTGVRIAGRPGAHERAGGEERDCAGGEEVRPAWHS